MGRTFIEGVFGVLKNGGDEGGNVFVGLGVIDAGAFTAGGDEMPGAEFCQML